MCGPICTKNESALHFVKLLVGFLFHFNRCNSVEKIGCRKNDNIHPSIHPSTHTKRKNCTFWPLDETPCNFWQNPHVLKFNLIEYYNM